MLYLFIFLFCIASACRDVMSELLLKGKHAPPPFQVIFIYSLTAQAAALTLMALRYRHSKSQFTCYYPKKHVVWQIISVNVFTAGAFIMYFFAIDTELGASENAFIDYGLGPLATGLIGSLILKEPLRLNYIGAAIACISGISVMVIGSAKSWGFSGLGLFFAASSCFCSVFYRINFKQLLENNVDKNLIVLTRLVLTTVISGVALLFKSTSSNMINIIIIGVLGFAFPLFISLHILQRVAIARFALFLFIVPIFTYAGSLLIGGRSFYVTDILGAVLIFIGVVYAEATEKKMQRPT